MWPDGLAHYVRAHGVRLPDEFVRHVKSRMQEPRKIAVDTSWWRHQKPQWHGLPTRPPMVFDPFDDDWRHDRASDEQRT
jgi:hypothetical protein